MLKTYIAKDEKKHIVCTQEVTCKQPLKTWAQGSDTIELFSNSTKGMTYSMESSTTLEE